MPNCKECKTAIRIRQHKLSCSQCEGHYHRTCLPKLSNSLYWKIKDTWSCTKCTQDENLTICNECNNIIYPDKLCFACFFPPIQIHDITDPLEISYVVDEPIRDEKQEKPTFHKGIKFAHLNVQGLQGKIEELSVYLQQNHFHIFACTETWLTNGDLTSRFEIPGYSLLRYDRQNKKGGGLCIYADVNSLLIEKSYDVAFPSNVQVKSFLFKVKFCQPFLITLLYNPPNVCKSEFIDSFESLTFHASRSNLRLITLGDFNVNLLANDTNTTNLRNVARTFSLTQLINEPTRVTNSCNSLLDHIYVDKPENFAHKGVFPLTQSDHYCTYAVFRKEKIKLPSRVIKFRTYRNVDWKKVKEEFELIDWGDFIKESSPAVKVEKLINHIQSIVDQHSPINRKRIKARLSPWLTPEILDLWKNRDRLRKRACKEKNERTLQEYRVYRNKVNLHIRQCKKNYYINKLSNNPDSKSVWKTYNEIIGKRKNQKIQINQLDDDGNTSTSPEKIADILGNAFSIKHNVNTVSNIATVSTAEDSFFTGVEIDNAFKQLKACSHYEIPHIYLTKLFEQLIPFLCNVFNSCLYFAWFPTSFKHALIHPLYKGKGSITSPLSYRPISTLPFLAKLFEKVIAGRLSDQVDSQLSDNQHGFRKGRSCFTALTVFTHKATTALNKCKNYYGAVFVDLKRAFDYVNPDNLIRSLHENYEISDNLLNLLHDYANNRSFAIVNNGSTSMSYKVHSICPQGSTLAPLLFALYFDMIKVALDLDYLLFADDLVFFYDSRNLHEIITKLSDNLTRLDDWCKNYGMQINYDKTKWMLFNRSKQSPEETMTVSCNGSVIEKVEEFKYLGLWVDRKLNFSRHFNHVKGKVAYAVGCLLVITKYVNLHLFKCLLNSLIYSIIDYALPIWGSISPSYLDQLQKKINGLITHFFHPHTRKLRHHRLCNSQLNEQTLNSLLEKCNSLTVRERFTYYTANFVFQTLKFSNKCTIESFKTLFVFSQRSRRQILSLQQKNNEAMESNLAFHGARLWNLLPPTIRNINLSHREFTRVVTQWCMKVRGNAS